MNSRKLILTPVVLFAISLRAQTLQPDPQLTGLVQSIRSEVNGDEALDFVTQIYDRDRWADFARFQQSAAWVQHIMHDIGLRNIETGSSPADGVTQFAFWTMPLAWDVQQARLEIVDPAVAPDMRVLADYSKQPASLIMWSGPTPKGGITADVVELRPATLEALKHVNVNRKMVLTDPPLDLARRGALKASLFKAGAAGMISYATENPKLVGDHYWMNAWGDYGWGFTKRSSPLVGFSITPRQGENLRNLLAHGKRIRVKAVAETRYYEGKYPYITGVIPGVDSAEEVLVLGHGFELGAQDNATGVSGMLEALASLHRLISAGKLPRPRRSIRVLVMSEDYGSSAYVATHMDQMKRTIGAICVDTPAGPYDQTPAYSFGMDPDVARSYQDALVMRVAETYYAAIPGHFPRWGSYRQRSDSYLSDPMIGVPTNMLIGSSGATNVHHNSADTIDRVDPRSLRDMSALLGANLYWLATASDNELPWLAQITADRAIANTRRAAEPHLDRIAAASADTLGHELYAGIAQIEFNANCDRQAVLSISRLASSAARDKLRQGLEPSLQDIARATDEQKLRLKRTANDRAQVLGAPVPVQPTAPPITSARREAAQIVVRRRRFGPVTLDDLPLDQREGYPGFGGSPSPLPLVLWCDAERNLAEVIHLYELENGPTDFDFVGYFRFLAKHGYVDLVPAQ